MVDWRALFGRILPWYDPERERRRDRHTDLVVQRSEAVRDRAAKVIDEYRQATSVANRGRRAADRAGEAVIDELRRVDDDH